MRWLARIIVAIAANGLGLIVASYIVPGGNFRLPTDLKQVFIIAVVLTLLNFVLKPILEMILGPVIFLTLGLGLIVVNVLVLFALTLLAPTLTIHGATAYLYASIILGLINFVFHLAVNPV